MRSILQKDYSREPKFHVSARELEMYDQKKWAALLSFPSPKFRGGKFLCRSCRFDMCVEIGMTYTIPVRKLQSKRKYSVEVELPTFPSSDLPIVHKESLLELMRVEYE